MKEKALKCDVLVVGAGIAGLCAALTALEAGRSTIVLESQDKPGGTTAVSEGFFSCFDPKRQVRFRIEDSPEKHLNDVLKIGRNRNLVSLAKTFCYESLPTLSWLEGLGFEFSDKIIQPPGAPYPRCHLPANGAGEAYAGFLVEQIRKRGGVLLTETMADSLMYSEALERIVGVNAVERGGHGFKILASCGVVLAYGGFQSNKTMLEKYSPMLAGAESMGADGCTGRLQAHAEDVGAQSVHCGYFVWRLCSRHQDVLRHPEKFILLDEDGRRFCREDLQFDALGERVLQQAEQRAWAASSGLPAAEAPFSRSALENAVASYNILVHQGRDSEFGKDPRLLKAIAGNVGVERVHARICTTLGGLLVDERARVVNRRGVFIRGLAAAGDCVGGLFGCWAAVGDTLASAAVFGRIAGRTIASSA